MVRAWPLRRPMRLRIRRNSSRTLRFWIRVYTEVTTDQGLLHDDWDLGTGL